MEAIDDRAAGGKAAFRTGAPYRLCAAAAATCAASPGSPVSHHLAEGTLVVVAEVGGDGKRVRISSPAGWIDGTLLEPVEPAPRRRKSFEEFRRSHLELAPGDYHGLNFPFSLDMFRDFGAEFLTAAFRAAGTIAQDNAVTAILAIDPLQVPGASQNALIAVSYAKAESGLHRDLFIKFPPGAAEFKYSLADMAHGEVAMLRFARERGLPVNVPYLLYGDYSSRTGNYILITERLRFGEGPIEPAYRKGFDHEVPHIEDHYLTLARAMASLTAAHKTGALGHDLESVFPYNGAARDFGFPGDPAPLVDRLVDFIARIAPHLLVPEAADPAFMQVFRDDLLYGFAHKDAVLDYLHGQVDYTGLCHPNLNIDNAWFWRDASGALQAGLFDWAGAGQMSIAQALSGMLMMQIPEKHIDIVDKVLKTYIAEYHRLGGIALDFDELHFQYKASLFSTALYTIVAWVTDYFFERMSEAEYAGIESRHDERITGRGLYQGIVWVDCMLREWLQPVTPGDVCRTIVKRAQDSSAPSLRASAAPGMEDSSAAGDPCHLEGL